MSLTDEIRSRLQCGVTHLGNALVHFLELRVPSALPELSDTNRKKILEGVKPGDIILTADASYLMWEGIEYAVAGSHFTHCMFYEGDGDVLEATIEANHNGVMRSRLENVLHGSVKVAVLSPPYPTDVAIQSVLEYCRQQLGKPYDNVFDMEHSDGKAFYCSSLLYQALMQLTPPWEIPKKHRLGRTLVVPDAFLHLEGASVLYMDKFTVWSSLQGAMPTAMGTAATTLALHLVFPHLAPVAAFYLTVSAGNKLQTGKFSMTGN